MRLSHLFTRTGRASGADIGSRNADLLTRGGFVHRTLAGSYSYLPLGLTVLRKIEQIVREEMVTVGGQEILMSALSPRENWDATGRWDTVDVLFKVPASGAAEYALNPTHEEVVTPLVKTFVQSYRDLPCSVFQIQTKFRNEPRAKSGVLRGREFLMKDMYSFHATREDLEIYYEKVKAAYFRVFERLGLKSYLVEASGGAFTKKRSHEFQVETDAGEDQILVCDTCNRAWNSELEITLCESCGGETRAIKGAEVGNIFDLGTKFSDAFELNFLDEKGERQPVIMGCYGIGVSRLLGVLAEVHHDERGLAWPESVSPARVQLINLGRENDEATQAAEKLYADLQAAGVSVLLDDRDARAGEKFADADLIGCLLRVVVSAKTLASGGIEVKKRNEAECQVISTKTFWELLSA